jgi:hypothetical protein
MVGYIYIDGEIIQENLHEFFNVFPKGFNDSSLEGGHGVT